MRRALIPRSCFPVIAFALVEFTGGVVDVIASFTCFAYFALVLRAGLARSSFTIFTGTYIRHTVVAAILVECCVATFAFLNFLARRRALFPSLGCTLSTSAFLIDVTFISC